MRNATTVTVRCTLLYYRVSEEQKIQSAHFAVSQIIAAVSLPMESTVTAAMFWDTVECGFETWQKPDQLCGRPIFLFFGYRSKTAGT